MILGREEIRFIRDLFSHYYRIAYLKLPKDLVSREFAFQTLESDIYVRHMSFTSESEVRAYLVVNTPKQSYYSTARYSTPTAPSYSEAEWRGSEIMFDIDADKLPGCQTLALGRGVEVVTEKCIDIAREALRRLIYVLESHMGFSEDELMIYFSGNRGFHVVVTVEDLEWLKLESRHRLELVDYLSGRGIDLKKLLAKMSDKKLTLLPPKPEDGGWRSLLALYSSNEVSDETIRNIAIPVDPLVTQDISRLIRIPNSINGKTGLAAKLVKISEVDNFKLDESLSPFDGYAVVKPNISFSGSLVGKKVKISDKIAVKIDIDVALYLVLNKLANVIKYELEHVETFEISSNA
ncbi:MAG: DNA primase small subunit [Sulfolobales archaeon]|nr:DNA primase small subunit [Sulfolobales archaeon]MDW8082418.1 DNA primase small subunit [Sulfolobales archaeon]